MFVDMLKKRKLKKKCRGSRGDRLQGAEMAHGAVLGAPGYKTLAGERTKVDAKRFFLMNRL
jgi:hypothetical protein